MRIGQALHRMLLLPQRSPEQESALLQLLDDQQRKASPDYVHQLREGILNASCKPLNWLVDVTELKPVIPCLQSVN